MRMNQYVLRVKKTKKGVRTERYEGSAVMTAPLRRQTDLLENVDITVALHAKYGAIGVGLNWSFTDTYGVAD